MTDFEFEKCASAELRIDAAVLGAVKCAECKEENYYIDIGEFLTDKPVCRVPKSRYKITLDMELGEDNPFVEARCFEQLELVLKNKIVRFCDCSVESTKTVVRTTGSIEIKVCINAESRDVIEREYRAAV